MKQSVSLCMLVRDEEANLGGCLEGVAGLFDEIIVVDTGSSDATRMVAEKYGAKVFDFPWIDDFAAARNESCRHASGQWIFWLDADDRIDAVNRRRLQEVIEKLPPVSCRCNPMFKMWCNCSLPDFSDAGMAIKHVRLFPNRPDLSWTGRIHERIMPVPGGAAIEVVQTDVTIYHSGYADTQQRARKIQRNARLIEREYLLDPDDAMTLYYLARQRLWQGRYGDCFRLAKRSIENDPSNSLSTTAQSFVMAADCKLKMNRLEEAVDITRQALERFPENLAILHQRGCLLGEMKQLEEAASCLERVVGAGRDKLSRAAMHPETQLPVAHMTLGNVYRAAKNFAAAELHFRAAIDLQPRCAEGYFLLGHLLCWLGRHQDAQEITRHLEGLAGSEYECAMLKGHASYYRRDFAAAFRWINAAVALRADKAYGWIVLGAILFEEGRDWERCRTVHEKVLAMEPRRTEVRDRLAQINAVLAKKAARATASADDVYSVHPGAMQISGLGQVARISHSC